MRNLIYLDHAAATPLDSVVAKAMAPYLSEKFYNPSATYLGAQMVSDEIRQARADVAHILGSKPSEIVFTSGGTEANNLAITGVMDNEKNGEILTSSIEHASVILPAERYKKREIPVGKDGKLKTDKLRSMISDKTVLISVVYANNEIGTVQPLREIAHLIKTVREHRRAKGNKRPLYLHSDACQAGNYLPLNVHSLGVDLMTINSGKIYGPKRGGVLFAATGIKLSPFVLGGGQENGLRSGTEDVAGIIGMARALQKAQEMRHTESERVVGLKNKFKEKLIQNFPGIKINGSNHGLPNIISVIFPRKDNERLMMALDETGVMCAVGSACSASSEKPSRTLKAIGLSDSEARSTLRFSLGRSNDMKQLDYTLGSLSKIIDSQHQ